MMKCHSLIALDIFFFFRLPLSVVEENDGINWKENLRITIEERSVIHVLIDMNLVMFNDSCHYNMKENKSKLVFYVDRRASQMHRPKAIVIVSNRNRICLSSTMNTIRSYSILIE
jgi:hypothetical protein